ncbi:hypothetical protein BD779DRAFT_290693 [Infundibulicybe gibba]|nr:hypothetical protein BD779DRAFT_290693 [Infundibulicybe gibba]
MCSFLSGFLTYSVESQMRCVVSCPCFVQVSRISPTSSDANNTTVRATAFIVRAVTIGSDSAGRHFGLLVGVNIRFDVGFPALLYLRLSLLCTRLTTIGVIPDCSVNIDAYMAAWGFFRLVAIMAMVAGVAGMPCLQSSNPHAVDFDNLAQKASATIFLILTALQAYQTLILTLLTWARVSSAARDPPRPLPEIKPQHCYIFCVISLLLLTREASATAMAMSNAAKLHNEHFWYPVSYEQIFQVKTNPAISSHLHDDRCIICCCVHHRSPQCPPIA